MTGPANAGIFVYAKNLQRLADFYQSVLSLGRRHVTDEMIVLGSAAFQIVVHAMPAPWAETVHISAPPQQRNAAAFKFFYTVADLQRAAKLAVDLGGEVLPQEWRGSAFIVRNAVDPEGNIFQLRAALAS